MKDEILTAISEGVLEGATELVVNSVKKAVEAGMPASEILNSGLIAGMNEVGVLFRDGEMFVPEVLVSAKALQAGIEIIRPALTAEGVEAAGKILTVTVEGDLHDIGIKLVGMMLEGAGFEVVNMGIDVKAEDIVAKVREVRPDILALSAMLTTTMTNMKGVMDALKEAGLIDSVKVMVGGAPLSHEAAEKLGAYYSADASEAVTVAKSLL